MNSIEALKEDLWHRWRRHFHDPTLEEETSAVQRVIYSRAPLFDLKDWTSEKFPPGGRFSAQPVAGSDNWVYELDEKGQPHTASHRHTINGVEWRGVYRYTADEVEYVEICFPQKIPSRYDRVTLLDQQPATFQRLSLNCGGHFPAWSSLGRNDLLEKITSDPRNFEIWIEEYEAKDGLIQTGHGYTEGLGSPARYSSLSFSYSAGKLQRIVRHWEGGPEETVFAARTSTSLQALSAKLSQRLAERIIDALKQAALDSLLVAVELSFRSADRYVPLVIPFREADRISSFPVLDPNKYQQAIQLSEQDFEPEMAEFLERLRTSERFEAGTKMLRAAARLITKQKAAPVPTAEAFLAYAVDWELEADEFPKILRDCGADSSSLKTWKKRGWLT